MQSIWSQNTQIPPQPALERDLRTDAVIIGAGLAGILTAYRLQKQGVSCIVLEADRIGSGQTKNTTAKVTAQHGLKYAYLIKKFGYEKARQYADANRKAISDYFNIAKDEGIDCRLEKKPSYLYTTANVKALEDEYKAARFLGIPSELNMQAQTELPFEIKAALCFKNQAQLDPLLFIKGLAEKLTVYEKTRAVGIDGNTVKTSKNKVTAKKIIITTHFPMLDVPGYYFMRLHQERSYVLALENGSVLQGMYYGIDEKGLSLRSYGNTLLLGGKRASHRTGENESGNKYELLRIAARKLYPDSRETAHWSAQDCVPLDGVPYIGRFSVSMPNVYTAAGFQKWGMTNAMAAAEILCDLAQDKPHPYEIFSPQRFTLSASAKTLAAETAKSVKGLSKSLLKLPQEKLDLLTNGHGGIIEVNGKKAGVYKDENGKVYAVQTRCTHLGCQLEWNPDEKSWDCPCHGSRFDYQGRLIDNPAKKSLNSLG